MYDLVGYRTNDGTFGEIVITSNNIITIPYDADQYVDINFILEESPDPDKVRGWYSTTEEYFSGYFLSEQYGLRINAGDLSTTTPIIFSIRIGLARNISNVFDNEFISLDPEITFSVYLQVAPVDVVIDDGTGGIDTGGDIIPIIVDQLDSQRFTTLFAENACIRFLDCVESADIDRLSSRYHLVDSSYIKYLKTDDGDIVVSTIDADSINTNLLTAVNGTIINLDTSILTANSITTDKIYADSIYGTLVSGNYSVYDGGFAYSETGGANVDGSIRLSYNKFLGQWIFSPGLSIDPEQLSSILPLGNDGEFLSYRTSSDTHFMDYALKVGRFVNDSESLAAELLLPPDNLISLYSQDQKNAYYAEFKGFSHSNLSNYDSNGNILYGYPASEEDVAEWLYDSDFDEIYNIDSTNTFSGLISSERYENYTIEATLSSPSTTDGPLGIIIASVEQDAREHTLTAIRRPKTIVFPDGTPYEFKTAYEADAWCIVYNYGQNDENILIFDIDRNAPATAIGTNPGETADDWSNAGSTRIRIEKIGSNISATTSQFGSTTLDYSTTFYFDLSSMAETEKFIKTCAYGFGAKNQEASSFSDIDFRGEDLFKQNIIDLKNNTAYLYSTGQTPEDVIDILQGGAIPGSFEYYPVDINTILQPGLDPYTVALNALKDVYINGRFYYNYRNFDTYWRDPNNTIRVTRNLSDEYIRALFSVIDLGGQGAGYLTYNENTGVYTHASTSENWVKELLSVVDNGGDSSGYLTYNDSTGVFTHASPSESWIRNLLSTTAVTASDGGELTYDENTGVFSFAPTSETWVEGLFNVSTSAASDGGSLSYASGTFTFAPASQSWVRGSLSVTDIGGDSAGYLRYNASSGVFEHASPSVDFITVTSRSSFQVSDVGGDEGGYLTYDSDTGIFEHASPSESWIRGKFSVTEVSGGDNAGYLQYDTETGVFTHAVATDEYIINLSRSSFSVTEVAGGDNAGYLTYDTETGVFTHAATSEEWVRGLISATTSGFGSLTYTASTGIVAYVGPSPSQITGNFSVVDIGGDSRGYLSFNQSTGVFTHSGTSEDWVRGLLSVNDIGGDSKGYLNYDPETGEFTHAGVDSSWIRTLFSVNDIGGDSRGYLNYDNTSGVYTHAGVDPQWIRSLFSVIVAGGEDPGQGNLEYDSQDGIFTYTGPTGDDAQGILPPGTAGNVAFVTQSETAYYATDWILLKGRFVGDDNDLSIEFNPATTPEPATLESVFNTWYRFSHRGSSSYPASLSETNAWIFNPSNDTVVCTQNTRTYVGFVSNNEQTNYTFSTIIGASSSDNDVISVVMAFVFSGGREYTLSAIRTQGGFAPTSGWGVYYNYGQDDQAVIYEFDPAVVGTEDQWAAAGNIKIEVIKTGTTITAETSQNSSTTLDPTTLITIDLTSDSRLTKFQGAVRNGFGAQSQNAAVFSEITSTGIDLDAGNTVYGINNGYSYAAEEDSPYYSILSTTGFDSDIPYGRLYHNPTLKKTWFKNQEDWTLISKLIDNTDSLAEGEINLYYTDSRSRAALSVIDNGGDGSLSYDSTSGIFTYTGETGNLKNVVEDLTPELGGNLNLQGYKLYDASDATNQVLDLDYDEPTDKDNCVLLSSLESIIVAIDANNNTTGNYFGIYANTAPYAGTINATTSIFRVDETGDVTVTGALYLPEGSTKGIQFPADVYGGSGDTAKIYLTSSSGEDQKLTLELTNDANDQIALNVPSDNGVKINGYTVYHTNNFDLALGLSEAEVLDLIDSAYIYGISDLRYVQIGNDLSIGGNLITGGGGTIDLDFDEATGRSNSVYLSSVQSAYIFLDTNDTETGNYFAIYNDLDPKVDAITSSNSIFKVDEDGTVTATGDINVTGGVNIGDGTADTRLIIKKVNGTSDDIQFFNGVTRMGEIGTQDSSWLRINQYTATNVYTPRLLRADGGFQSGYYRNHQDNGVTTVTGGISAGGNIELGGPDADVSIANKIFYDAAVHTFRDHDASPTYATLDATGWTVNGDINAPNFNSTSDKNLKENIQPITNAIDKVKAINGITFNFIDKPERHAGVIAQDVEEVLPEAVTTNSEGVKSVAYGNLVGLLIEAIKDQQTQIDELKSLLKTSLGK